MESAVVRLLAGSKEAHIEAPSFLAVHGTIDGEEVTMRVSMAEFLRLVKVGGVHCPDYDETHIGPCFTSCVSFELGPELD